MTDIRNCFNHHPRPCIRCRHYQTSYSECAVRRPENTKEDPVQGRIVTVSNASGMRKDEALCGYDGRWFEEAVGSLDRIKNMFTLNPSTT